MRTTLTIDDEAAALVRKEMRKTGEPLKQVINRAIKLGLTNPKHSPQKPFKVKPWNLQPPPGHSFDNIEELIEFLEGPYHR